MALSDFPELTIQMPIGIYRNKLEKTIIYLLVSSLVSFSTSLSKADKSEKLEQSLLTM